MTTIIIIASIVLFIYATFMRNEIDKEEMIAKKTPGRADMLREHFGDVLNRLLNQPDHKIVMERKYDESVRISNSKGQELFMSCSTYGTHEPNLHIACIQDSIVIKRWKFDTHDSYISITNQISDYFS